MAKLSPEMAAPSKGGDYENCPEGVYQAVLCDIKDEGYRQNKFYDPTEEKTGDQFQPQVAIVFQLEENMSDGRPFTVRKPFLTVPRTLENPKGNLRKFLIELLGKPKFDKLLASIAAGEFDPDDLIGTNGRINVIHTPDKKDPKKIYANIGNIFPWTEKDGPLLEVRDFTRYQDTKDVEMPNPSAWEPRSTALPKLLGEQPAARQPAEPESTPDAPVTPPAQKAPKAAEPAATTTSDALTPEDIAEFQKFFIENFNPTFAVKELEKFVYQISKQNDFKQLRKHQLDAVKFQMNNLDTKYWLPKSTKNAQPDKPDLDALEELGEDPFANE